MSEIPRNDIISFLELDLRTEHKNKHICHCEPDAKSHAKPGGARDSGVGKPRRVKWGS